jgi:hypothetical protein
MITFKVDRVSLGGGMQHLKNDAIPLPALAGDTAFTAQFLHRRTQFAHNQCRLHRGRATRMVTIAMRHHQHIDAADPQHAQVRHDNALAGVRLGAVERPRVVDQRVFAGPDNGRKPLTDVQHIDPRLTLGRFFDRPEKRRNHQGNTQHPSRHAAWQ